MNIIWRFVFAMIIIVLSTLYIVPWKSLGINVNNDFLNKPFTLGLDLQGGVELDYQVDLSAVKNSENFSGAMIHTNAAQTNNEAVVVEGLKKIIDKRVGSLGLSEPNIQTLKYGTDTHIVVQIPTESYSDLSDEERKKRQEQDIATAKEVIGKVVNLEFKELRTTTTDEEYEERKKLAENASEDIKNLNFNILSQKYHKPNDNIFVKSGTGEIPTEAKVSALENFDKNNFPKIFDAETVLDNISVGTGATETSTGYVALRLDKDLGEGKYEYSYVRVEREPGVWAPAKTADGRILNDEYLGGAVAFIDQNNFQPKISLNFNAEGAKMFGEITTRLKGRLLAIFVGDEMVMSANVNDAITTGQAEISGGYATLADAQEVADNITTGIVPAPIYLTSERTIDAKIGETALSQILVAGIIGLSAIVVFLTAFYRVGGLLAGIALLAYAIILIAIIKMSGVTLTLAAIAGVILSIGLAIDANILIFERIHEALKEKKSLSQAIEIGFENSWTAIWDSHITSFLSAFILFAVGTALIKGFGFMLGIGIILSLFTAMFISRALIAFTAKYIKNPKILVGFSEKK